MIWYSGASTAWIAARSSEAMAALKVASADLASSTVEALPANASDGHRASAANARLRARARNWIKG